MNNNTIKSLIRHSITALGMLLVAFGLTKWAGALEIAALNFDEIWDILISFIGGITTILGFFKNSDRLS